MPHLVLEIGTACTSDAMEPSHVLITIGLSREQASSTIRLSAGRFTDTSYSSSILQ